MNFNRQTIIFFVFWIVGIIVIIWSGSFSDHYRQYVLSIPPPHPYPVNGIILTVLFQLFEVFIFYKILRPNQANLSVYRTFFLFLVLLCFVVFFGLSQMHAPAYIFWHWFWLVLATMVIFTVLLFLIIKHLWLKISS